MTIFYLKKNLIKIFNLNKFFYCSTNYYFYKIFLYLYICKNYIFIKILYIKIIL